MLGFKYDFEIVRDGSVIDRFSETNLIPTEGKTHILDVTCKGGTQYVTWYVGVYEGDYTPTSTVTAATLNSLATESTAYSEAARPTWVEGAIAAGAVDNSANKAEFTMTSAKTLYGSFLSSASTKGTTSGTLLSIVRFSSSKAMQIGDVLRVTATVNLS